jgi:outer membrane protein OmpA-like peptidoglycan-associated protein
MNESILSRKIILGITGFSVWVLSSCTSMPERIEVLEDARKQVMEVVRDPVAMQVAGNEVTQARQALSRAEAALADNGDLVYIRHNAYVALRNAEIAKERIAESRLRQKIVQSEGRLSEVLMAIRTREAERAIFLAETRRRDAERRAMEANLAREEAEQAREHAENEAAKARNLKNSLADLNARQTNRGLVVTLGDVLFETDKFELEAGAQAAMEQLAKLMVDHPERRLLIEGHTDSLGPDTYNLSLSTLRAEAVRDALVSRGVDTSRITTEGLGEAYPVASNDTAGGRQENRRVEIVISDGRGSFPETAERDTETLQ